MKVGSFGLLQLVSKNLAVIYFSLLFTALSFFVWIPSQCVDGYGCDYTIGFPLSYYYKVGDVGGLLDFNPFYLCLDLVFYFCITVFIKRVTSSFSFFQKNFF